MVSEVHQVVRDRYAGAAVRAQQQAQTSCCAGTACCSTPTDPISGGLYTAAETAGLPDGAVIASLGCGNPTALARLVPGQVVLDLGSGGGIDVLLSARRVGPTGHAFGVDMTDEMLELARANAAAAGASNVTFLKGTIEDVPLPDASVDVIISNCVINLSPDKPAVFAEAFRVLRPGGRLAISDVVATADLPDDIRNDLALYNGCVAGATQVSHLEEMMANVGFENIRIMPNLRSKTFIERWAPGRNITDHVASATIEATKPHAGTGPCCR